MDGPGPWALVVALIVLLSSAPARSEDCITAGEREIIASCGSLDEALANARAEGISRLSAADEAKLRALHAAACAPMSLDDRFTRAKLLRVAGTEALAAVAFDEITSAPRLHHAASRQTQGFALTMQIEALSQLLRVGRDACIDTALAVAERADRELCVDGEPAEPCELARRVQIDAARLRLVDGADVDRPQDLKRRAVGLVELWRRFGAGPCEQMEKTCRGFEVVLYNAARFYDAAGERPAAARVRRLLVDPRFNLQATHPALRARSELVDFYASIGRFDRAVAEGLTLVALGPKLEEAPAVLLDTLRLQIGLGDMDGAVDSLSAFHRLYGRKRHQRTTTATLLVAEALLEAGELERARKILSTPFARNLGHRGHRDDVIEAHRLMARLESDAGNEALAATAYGHILDLTKGMAELGALDELSTSSLDGLGEALLFHGDRRRETTLARIAAGPRTNGFEAWATNVTVDLAETERAYQRIAELKPATSPRWLVEAAERRASMHRAYRQRLAEVVRRPGGGVLRDILSMETRLTRKLYTRCHELAVEREQLDDSARRCLKALDEIDERRALPTLGPGLMVGGGLVRPSTPLPDPRPTRSGSSTD